MLVFVCREDRRRVHAREPLNPQLGWCAAALGVADELDDMRQRRIAGRLRRLDVQSAVSVIVPAKAASPGCFDTGTLSPVIGA
jgi:hypothetical protein